MALINEVVRASLNPTQGPSAVEPPLKTHLIVLDEFLRGGIARGSVMEIVGPAGAGKTQFCHMMTSRTLLPKSLGGEGIDASVLYIDMEKTFSANRVIEMAELHGGSWMSVEGNIVPLNSVS